MIFKHCSLITFNRYDQTITMVASRGHVKSLNLGIKITKNWLFSLSECAHLHAKTKKRSKICSFLPWDHAKVQKKRHDFWRIPHTKSKSTHFPHTTGEDTNKKPSVVNVFHSRRTNRIQVVFYMF